MRKYAIAGFAGLMIFSLAAFASSLIVNPGTIQSGAANLTNCQTDPVTFSYGTSTDGNGFYLTSVTGHFDGACVGMHAFMQGLKSVIPNSGGNEIFFAIQKVANDGTATATFTSPNFPRVQDLNSVDVLVKDQLAAGETDGWVSVP